MKFLATILVCLIGYTSNLIAADEHLNSDENIKVYLEPDENIYVGQLVRFWVEITTSTRFTRAPHYPDLPIDGAIAVMPEQLGVNLSSNDFGTTRVGQRQRYAVIPQRSGQLSIPPLNVTLGVEVDGKPSDIMTLTTKPLSFNVIIPPGSDNNQQLVSTNKLSAQETYEGETENLKVGDAITRKITVKADDMLAVALPAITFKEVENARIYPAQPVLKNSANRGQYSATRTDSATYILEREGRVELPAIKISWWDLKNKELRDITLPALSFEVAPNPDQKTTPSPSSGDFDSVSRLNQTLLVVVNWLRDNIVLITLGAVCIYITFLVCYRYFPPLMRRLQNGVKRAQNSEFVAFLKLCRNVLLRNQDSGVQSFWNWLDHSTPDNQSASLETLTRKVRERKFNSFANSLTANRYSTSIKSIPNKDNILQQLRGFRKKLLGRGHRKQNSFEKELNPRR